MAGVVTTPWFALALQNLSRYLGSNQKSISYDGTPMPEIGAQNKKVKEIILGRNTSSILYPIATLPMDWYHVSDNRNVSRYHMAALLQKYSSDIIERASTYSTDSFAISLSTHTLLNLSPVNALISFDFLVNVMLRFSNSDGIYQHQMKCIFKKLLTSDMC